MEFVRHIARAAAVMALAACGSSGATGIIPVIGTFVVQVGSEQLSIRVVDQATCDKLTARLQSGKEGVILGRVATGDGGFNGPWSWHLVPSTIDAPQLSIELCDGTPRISRRIGMNG